MHGATGGLPSLGMQHTLFSKPEGRLHRTAWNMRGRMNHGHINHLSPDQGENHHNLRHDRTGEGPGSRAGAFAVLHSSRLPGPKTQAAFWINPFGFSTNFFAAPLSKSL
jgi:hypothetical protein